MGLLNFLKHLNAQVKCDKNTLEKYNWVFLGNRMQHLAMNKNILVEENQLCFFMSKNKLCDVLKQGSYKVCEQDLPLLFDRNNIHKKLQKTSRNNKGKRKTPKINISCDVYFLKENNFSYTIPLKNKYNINNISVKEIIDANIKFSILDLHKLVKFLFLNISTVSTERFNKSFKKEFKNFLDNEINNYKGDLSDLEDKDAVKAIEYRFTHEFALYGLDIVEFNFSNYQDLTKNTRKVVSNIVDKHEEPKAMLELNSKEEIVTEEEIENNNYVVLNTNNNQVQQDKNFNESIESQKQQIEHDKQDAYTAVLKNGKITIDPSKEN